MRYFNLANFEIISKDNYNALILLHKHLLHLKVAMALFCLIAAQVFEIVSPKLDFLSPNSYLEHALMKSNH